jgi:hypothetical protein
MAEKDVDLLIACDLGAAALRPPRTATQSWPRRRGGAAARRRGGGARARARGIVHVGGVVGR